MKYDTENSKDVKTCHEIDDRIADCAKARRYASGPDIYPCLICRLPTPSSALNEQACCQACVNRAIEWHRRDIGGLTAVKRDHKDNHITEPEHKTQQVPLHMESCCVCKKDFPTTVMVTQNKGMAYCSLECWHNG